MRAARLRRQIVAALKPLVLSSFLLSTTSLLSTIQLSLAQDWQPTRLPANSSSRPLTSLVSDVGPSEAQPAKKDPVVLRWRAPKTASVDPSQNNLQPSTSPVRTVGWTANPLRGQVSTAAYQSSGPQNSDNQTGNPFGDEIEPPNTLRDLPPMPQLPSSQSDSNLNQPDSNFTRPNVQLPDSLQLPDSMPKMPDPLSRGEDAPAPGGVGPDSSLKFETTPANPFSNNSPSDSLRSNLDKEPERIPAPKPETKKDEEKDSDVRKELDLPRRKRNANTQSCDEMRQRARSQSINEISLNISPHFGEGLRSKVDPEKQRMDFVMNAPVRDWTDINGNIVATGKLIDLKNGLVWVEAVQGIKSISLSILSDMDQAYIGKVWNLPIKCGLGYETYAGRNFTPSAMEWKASGLCNKPLYYEEVQLERYGHEIGPILQPLFSSAHFFTNTLILPYKMGINPPTECQYALGYYRPGSCAPYMIPPFPWSLRGAAAQAKAVVGAAALIP